MNGKKNWENKIWESGKWPSESQKSKKKVTWKGEDDEVKVKFESKHKVNEFLDVGFYADLVIKIQPNKKRMERFCNEISSQGDNERRK